MNGGKMEKLKSTLFCVLALLLSLPLFACERIQRLPPDYRDHPFCVRLQGENGMLSLSAEGIYTPADTSDEPWRFTLRIESKSFPNGLTLCGANGSVSLSYEDLTVNAATMDGLVSLALLPIPKGDMTPISLDKSQPIPLLYTQIREEGCDPIELWLDPNSGYPKRICQGALQWEILSFEALPSDT